LGSECVNAILLSTVGSCFAMVRFMTIHFYDPCPVGPSTPDLWCITAAMQASFPLLSAFQTLFQCSCVSSYSIFSAVLLGWLWFFHPCHPSKRQKRRKKQKSRCYIISWCPLNHGLGLLQRN